jgi:type III pantothenate kinase
MPPTKGLSQDGRLSESAAVLTGPRAARKRAPRRPPSLFVVDIGNSALKMALFAPDDPPFSFALEWGAFPGDIRAFLGEIPHRARDDLSCGICSVVPSRNDAIASLIRHYLEVTPVFLTSDSDYSFVNGYETPWTVGVDRLCAVEGALADHEPPLAVFAFGTALAVTLVSQDRVLTGGWIATGFHTGFRALQEYAELLRNTPLESPVPEIARNTPSAVSNGLYLLMRGGILEIKSLARASIGDDCAFLATGGEAALFRDLFHECDEDLVLKGIARVLSRLR